MRLWFSPDSEVPIYRQLVTQVTLAILSGDLRPGDKLPSTRELARRFRIHPNTFSAGYRQLERDGWTVCRHGSGVYVKANADPPTSAEQILEQHIAAFFRIVRELNLPAEFVRERVAQWLASPPPDHFLLIDPDAEMRDILLTEIRQLTSWPAVGIPLEGCARSEKLKAAVPLCRPSKQSAVRSALPNGIELITLQIRSAHTWLTPWLPVLQNKLVGVVSHWPDFLEIARTVLVAVGIAPDVLVLRDARRPRWNRGLDQTGAIICDAYTAATRKLPAGPRVFVFPLLADSAGEELRRFA